MLSDDSLDILFRKARSHNGWLDKKVTTQQLKQIYALMKYGSTSANSCPMRLVFIISKGAKERLKKHLNADNIEKSMQAPVVAIIAYDKEFYQKLPMLFPHNLDAKNWFIGSEEKISVSGTMNATLQGAYFMLAARALGLDCGPMAGFNNISLDGEFFSRKNYKSIFLCALGYGDKSKIFPRSPRLDFASVCNIC